MNLPRGPKIFVPYWPIAQAIKAQTPNGEVSMMMAVILYMISVV